MGLFWNENHLVSSSVAWIYNLFSPHLCIDSKHNLHFIKISENCMSFSKFLKANFHDLLMEKSYYSHICLEIGVDS